jgi:TPR repeat protein
MYESGRGVSKDYIAACMWFSLASMNGLREAVEAQQELAARMTNDEMSQAHALAVAWMSDFRSKQ